MFRITGLNEKGMREYVITDKKVVDGKEVILGHCVMRTTHFNMATVQGHPEIEPKQFDNLTLAAAWMKTFLPADPQEMAFFTDEKASPVDPAIITPEEAARESGVELPGTALAIVDEPAEADVVTNQPDPDAEFQPVPMNVPAEQ